MWKCTGNCISLIAAHSGSHIGCHIGVMSQEQDSSTPFMPNLATRRTSAAAPSMSPNGRQARPICRSRMVRAELPHEVVVDAQHLDLGLAVLQLRGSGEHAIDDLGIDAVAVEFLGRRSGSPGRRMPFLPSSYSPVSFIRSARCCLPGT